MTGVAVGQAHKESLEERESRREELAYEKKHVLEVGGPLARPVPTRLPWVPPALPPAAAAAAARPPKSPR